MVHEGPPNLPCVLIYCASSSAVCWVTANLFFLIEVLKFTSDLHLYNLEQILGYTPC